jgi:WD40 repeat protein
MRSLLQYCDAAIVVGLDTRAFLINGDSVCELKQEKTPTPATNGAGDPQHDTTMNPLEIQCVAISKDSDNTIWCAVSRSDKSLAIYRHSTLQMVHVTAKRSSCLTFAWSNSLGGMVLVGDLVGDATAFPLQGTRKGRLLLGHTASMLTGIRLVGTDTLLTADRDEKIRVSSFPQTCIIKGFLLGHSAFLCSIDTTADDLCVTCGGDCTVRLWQLSTFSQMAQVDTNGLLPVQVSTNGEHVAVIFHNSSVIHIYSLMTLELQQTLESEAQPLGVVLQDATMVVLSKEPTLLHAYKLGNSNKYESTTDDRFLNLNEQCKDVTLASSILETDRSTGQLKLGKIQETRTSNPADIPWNRVDRIQKARDSRNRRNKKRKTEL